MTQTPEDAYAMPAQPDQIAYVPEVTTLGNAVFVPAPSAYPKPAPVPALKPPTMTIDAEPVDWIPIDLVGVRYLVRAPKSVLGLMLAVRAKNAEDSPDLVWESIVRWVTVAFGEEAGAGVLARLEDSEDLLDVNHIMTLVQKIAELGGNPTGS